MGGAIKTELTCKELVDLVTEYLEDRLPRPDRTRFELHVCTCRGCRAHLAQMRALVQASGRLAEDDLPPAAREELLAAFREWKRSSRSAPGLVPAASADPLAPTAGGRRDGA